MFWMPLPGLLLAAGRPKSSGIFGLWVCQHPLLMMAQFPLTIPAFVQSLLASIMRSGKDCTFPGGLRLPEGHDLCTYHRWSARIGPVSQPNHLALSDKSLRRLFRFRLGAHSLPVKMGRRLRMARVAHVCPLCPGMHLGDERHYVFDCPSFDDIRIRHSQDF